MKKNSIQEPFVTITIDKNNIIASVGDGWDDSAKEGGAQNTLTHDKVIGKHITKYLWGDSTKMYYEAVFQSVRASDEPDERDYRCDSPTHQRYMRVYLIPNEDRSIKMIHELIKAIPFENIVNIHEIENILQYGKSYIKRCSICNKLLFPNSTKWVLPEEINSEPLELFVVHIVCPECEKRYL